MITGLVLQGGGALGAFELGVIEWMLDNRIAPDVVSGVSIGAINATVLAGSRHPDPRDELRALWAELATPALPPPFDGANGQVSLFGNAAMYAPRVDYVNLWHWTSLYETAPLRRTLERHVDFQKLGPDNFARPAGARAPRLILTATNLVTGKLDRFDSQVMNLTPSTSPPAAACPPASRRRPPPRRTGRPRLTGTAGSSTTRRCPRSSTRWKRAPIRTRPCTW